MIVTSPEMRLGPVFRRRTRSLKSKVATSMGSLKVTSRLDTTMLRGLVATASTDEMIGPAPSMVQVRLRVPKPAVPLVSCTPVAETENE